MLAIVEVAISRLLRGARGRDEKTFCRSPALAGLAGPTVEVTSPEAGAGPPAAPARLGAEHSADGAGRIPSLGWREPAALAGRVREWLLVVEDPDAPLPTPIVHGIYAGIDADRTSIGQSDLEVLDDSKNLLSGGFHYGMCRRPVVYIPPRPLLNHGPHRYFFQIVALSEPLPKALLEAKPQPTREQIAEEIRGKVLGWGIWVGQYERKW